MSAPGTINPSYSGGDASGGLAEGGTFGDVSVNIGGFKIPTYIVIGAVLIGGIYFYKKGKR